MKLIIKFLLFSFLLFFISFYFSFSGYERVYTIKLETWEYYNLYHWSILWHFWLFPFNILEAENLERGENIFSPFVDILKFSLQKIVFVFLNLFAYFIVFCFSFKKEIKYFFKNKKIFSLNNFLDNIWKMITLIFIYIAFINFLVIFIGDILFI